MTSNGSGNGNGRRGIAEATPPGQLERRVLLVADETFHGEDFLSELQTLGFSGEDEELSVFVVTPALPGSPVGQAAGDIDDAVVEAYTRLEAVLGELRQVGVVAAGIVGDTDPLTAVGDGLRLFDADDVILVAHVEKQATWTERDLWERLDSSFDKQVSTLLVDRPGQSGEAANLVETRRNDGQAQTSPAPRDLLGLFFAIFGTIVLGFVSISAGLRAGLTFDGGSSGPLVAILLIALGAFLFNVATTVILTLFLSLGYRGFWERFIAGSTIAVTTVSLLLAGLIWLVFVF